MATESEDVPEPQAPPTRMRNPWYNRLGHILASYCFAYLALAAYQDQPDGKGYLIALGIAAGCVIAALRDTIKARGAKS